MSCLIEIFEELHEAEIKRLLEIEKECRLSNWTTLDYQKETKRKDSIILVAKSNDKIVGFLTSRLISSGVKANGELNFSEIDILNFGVRIENQKQGIGKSLLNQLLKKAAESDVDSIWLEVREQNKSAIYFYRSNGFAPVQLRNSFYANPTDNAIVMKYQLAKTNE